MISPDWTKTYTTPLELAKDLGIIYAGPGWYKQLGDTILLTPIRADGSLRDIWATKQPGGTLIHASVWSAPFHDLPISQLHLAPTRI